jgi:hypothetical protein
MGFLIHLSPVFPVMSKGSVATQRPGMLRLTTPRYGNPHVVRCRHTTRR